MAINPPADIKNFWNSLEKFCDTDEYLEQYLVIGISEGFLKDFSLLPTIKRKKGRDWIPFFFKLAQKTALKEVFNASRFNRTYQYSVLGNAIEAGFELMRRYGLSRGLDNNFIRNANLTEVCYSYGLDFDHFLDTIEIEFYQGAIGRDIPILSDMDDTPIRINITRKESANMEEFAEPESDMESSEESEPESDTEKAKNLDIENDRGIMKKLEKSIRHLNKKSEKKHGIDEFTKPKSTKRNLKVEREDKKKAKRENGDLPKEVKVEKKECQKKLLEPDFVLTDEMKKDFIIKYCENLNIMYKSEKIEDYPCIGNKVLKIHEPLLIFNTGPSGKINFEIEFKRFHKNITNSQGIVIPTEGVRIFKPSIIEYPEYFIVYIYVGNGWWYSADLTSLENAIYGDFVKKLINDEEFIKILEQLEQNEELLNKLYLKKGKTSSNGKPIVLDGPDVTIPVYKSRDKRFEWVSGIDVERYGFTEFPIFFRMGDKIYYIVRVMYNGKLVPIIEKGNALYYYLADVPPECDKRRSN